MNHKTAIISIILLLSTNLYSAELPNNTFIERCDSIQVEMTRKACEIAEFNKVSNGKALRSIENLVTSLKNKNKKLFNVFDQSRTQLEDSTSNESYQKQLTQKRQLLLANMLISYGEKEDEILNAFNADSDIAKAILSLTEESKETQTDIINNQKITYIYNPIEQTHSPYRIMVRTIVILILFVLLIYGFMKYLTSKKKKQEIEEAELEAEPEKEIEEEKKEETKPEPISDQKPEANPEPEPEPTENPKPKEKPEPKDELAPRVEENENEISANPEKCTIKFADSKGDWIIAGTSVQGNGHLDSNLPCQDYCAYENLGNGWGIAITSDGAGSARHSDIGSRITVSRTMHYFKSIIEKEQWIEKQKLPSDIHWTKLAYQILKAVHDDTKSFAEKKNIELNSLNATVIALIHSPKGLLVAHVGDGRAGYRDRERFWHPAIIPHKGEEANQTIFVASDFWDIPFYEMSEVMVPEARIIREPITAFTLMSDGCENTTWLYNQRNEKTGRFYDPNQPYEKFFEPLVYNFLSNNTISDIDIAEKWFRLVDTGNQKFIDEIDDKTLIMGVLK